MRRARIVTHNGAAHRDEFLACCVILHHEHAAHGRTPSVERRLVVPSDLEDSGTYVVDTGGRWDPGDLNFDHHQADPKMVDKCALDLVLEYVMGRDVYRGFAKANEWLRVTTVQDTRGNAEAALSLGVNARAYSAMRSPMERLMLSWFADAHTVHADSALHATMRELGRLLLCSATDIATQQVALQRIPGPVEHLGIRLWDVRPAWDSDERNSFAVINEMAARLSVDVVVSHNLRHAMVGLYRQEWADGKLDLSLLSPHPKFHSAHKNGFYAVVTADVQDFELFELLALARTGPVEQN